MTIRTKRLHFFSSRSREGAGQISGARKENSLRAVFRLRSIECLPGSEAERIGPAPSVARRDAKGGFTLVELLVVLVILGLVMGLVGPRVLGYLSSSRERTARLQIEGFASALDLFYLDYGRYPTKSEGLDALVHKPGSGDRWAGPYLKQANVPKDPWGNPYDYHIPGKTSPYSITSPGPDGKSASGERAVIGSE